MVRVMNNEWRIRNIATDGPGRNTPGGDAWDEQAGEPFYALLVDRIDQRGWFVDQHMAGYCEACEEDHRHGETMIDLATIADVIDKSDKGTCLRCGYEDATPYYGASESKSKLAAALSCALLPPSLAPEWCPWCDDGEPCPRSIHECPAQRMSAIMAGIPRAEMAEARKLK